MSKARQLADLGNVYDDGALSNRNLIINGAMQVAQRASSVTGVTLSGYYTTDRIRDTPFNLGTWTSENSSNAPDGFSNSHKLTCTTADASPAASDFVIVTYTLEAQNLQQLSYGTSSAKPMTLSFWVKSNKTGGASVDMYQPDNSNRQWSDTYSINSADTWEYKTLTIPADTSGLINNDSGGGLVIDFWLNSGSTYSGGSYQTTWAAIDNPSRNVNNLGVGGSVNDYWQITGVQLEVGDTATPFEHRSYGDELVRCQRYYEIMPGVDDIYTGVASNITQYSVYLITEKRAVPTVQVYGIGGYPSNAGKYDKDGVGNVAINVAATSPAGFRVYNLTGSGQFAYTADAEL